MSLAMYGNQNLFRWSIIWLFVMCAGSKIGFAREWTDASGRLKWKAEILAGSKQLVVLRDRKGELQAVQVSELSDAPGRLIFDLPFFRDSYSLMKEIWVGKSAEYTMQSI